MRMPFDKPNDVPIIVVIVLLLLVALAHGQTHTFPGNNVFPSTSTTDFNAGATVDFTGATVTGLAGGAVSSVFTRTGAVVALVGDYSAFYQPLDTDLTTWAGLTPSANFQTMVPHTFSQMRTDLSLVPGTNVEVPLTFSQSVSRATNTVTLSGDSASPGNTMLYGTNGSGTKGWYAQPTGASVSITATSPIVVTPTPLTGTGVVSLNAGVDLALTTGQNVTLTDSATAAISEVLTLTHNSTGAPASGFGTGLMFQGKSDTTNGRAMGEIAANWSNSTDASRLSYLRFRAASSTGLSSTQVYMFNSGGLAAGTATDPGASIISANGFKINSITAASGSILQGDGSKFVGSTPTWPTSNSAAGRIIRGNGTNFVESTATWPDTAGTAGNMVVSDGTNWTSVPRGELYVAGSAAGSSPSTTNILIPGSTITIPAGTWKAGGSYRCTFDMAKTAGTGAIAINVHMGTLGTTGDTIVATATFAGAGTSVADQGLFEVFVTFKAVGSGTTAVIYPVVRLIKTLTTTGLVNSTTIMTSAGGAASSGFNSTTQTKLSIGFNGGTAFAGTNNFCQTEYTQ